ncbi:hypothetical protein LWI28_018208 [Acer negundo]|uniref:Retrovirus-related Pol polyprotein from transposon TNT 1-94-like beta-barrel domain-containing protein n=1 Tax=Acer negundo TaxID=4023 RepID=A0AAD5NZV2_ACENE|nr:hypothetical protein LWI28_018208 [Acer negundo]
MGNIMSYKVVGNGTIRIQMFDGIIRILSDVQSVPDLNKNLISLGIIDSQGYKFSSKETIEIQELSTYQEAVRGEFEIKDLVVAKKFVFELELELASLVDEPLVESSLKPELDQLSLKLVGLEPSWKNLQAKWYSFGVKVEMVY